jgi:thiamine biosynthesis lipoprotein
MKQTKLIMGMPITVNIADTDLAQKLFDDVFEYFTFIDGKFSTYKSESEISLINQGKISQSDYSEDMKTVFALSEETKKETNGYFDILHEGKLDPSGLVKGWAIHNAAKMLLEEGIENFYIDAGGDIQVAGSNQEGKPWAIGIRSPFKTDEIIKVVYTNNKGVATSGTYIRGSHIYNPKAESLGDLVSLTVIGPNVYEADRFATAAFAMGDRGINFIESLSGFEGYAVYKNGTAIFTNGFEHYT